MSWLFSKVGKLEAIKPSVISIELFMRIKWKDMQMICWKDFCSHFTHKSNTTALTFAKEINAWRGNMILYIILQLISLSIKSSNFRANNLHITTYVYVYLFQQFSWLLGKWGFHLFLRTQRVGKLSYGSKLSFWEHKMELSSLFHLNIHAHFSLLSVCKTRYLDPATKPT